MWGRSARSKPPMDGDLRSGSDRPVKEGVAAFLSGVTDRDAAEALKGVRLFVPRSALPELPAGEEEYYLADLIGLAVRWVDGPQAEGRIVAVHNFGAGDLIEIEPAATAAGKCRPCWRHSSAKW